MQFSKSRNFRRYDQRSRCILRLDSGSIEGETIDYSDGLCAVFKDAPDLPPGTQVTIKVFNPDMEFPVTVQWAEQLGDMTKAGFSRLDTLQGSLRDFALADVLMGLQRGKETGILKVEGDSQLKYVILKKGEMVFALSSMKGDQLIEILLREKKITAEEYIRVERLHKNSTEKAARILVTLGIMKPRDVFNETRYQVELIILSLFSLQEGKFIFLKGRLPEEEFPDLHINIESFIYRSIKSLDNLNHIKQAFPAPDAILEVFPDAARLLQGNVLDETDRQILSLVNSDRSLEDISRLSPSDKAETLKTICVLMSLRAIRVVKEIERPQEMAEDTDVKQPAEDVHPEFLQKVEALSERYETTDFYEILDVTRDASDDDIRTAYFRLSEELQPGRYASSFPNDLKTKQAVLLNHIDKVYATLSDLNKRTEYDMSLAPGADEPHEEEVLEEEMLKEEDVTRQTDVTKVSDLSNNPPPVTDDTEPHKTGKSGKRIEMGTHEEAMPAEAPEEDAPAMKVEEQKIPETTPPVAEEIKREPIPETEAPENKRSYIPIVVGIAAVIAVALFFLFRDSVKKEPPATALLTETVTSRVEEKQSPPPPSDDPVIDLPVMESPTAVDIEPAKPEPDQLSVKEPAEDKNGPQTQTVLAKEDVPSTQEKVPEAVSEKKEDVAQEKVPEAVPEKSVTDISASGDEALKEKETRQAKEKKKRPVPDKALFAAQKPREEEMAPPKIVPEPPPVIDAVSEEESARSKNEHFMRYKDQFNNNANKWETYDMTMAAARIEDGKYYIQNKLTGSETLILHHADFPLDKRIAIEAVIKVIKKDKNNYTYGFVIGAKDPSNYYALLVSGDNRYSVRKHHKGVSEELIAGDPGDGIILADSFNTLKIEIQGQKMLFFINGHRVAEVPDLTLFGKRIGFLVGGKSEIAVDYTRSQIWLD